MPDKTIALLDGDIFAFEIAASSEVVVNWGDGIWSLHSEEGPAISKLDSRIKQVADQVGADEIIVALSDDTANWRKDVLPTYKDNRAGQRKPLLLKFLKEYIAQEYTTYIRPRLEADDVLGILSTWPKLKGRKVICTKDKDLATIPGHFFDMNTEEEREVSVEEADRFHLIQSLAGDPTDNYTGCPGIGLTTAAKIVDEPFGWEQYEHEFKSGKRKGETEWRWQKTEVTSVWEGIVSHFHKAGLGEQEALTQARVARICRSNDYDMKAREVRLWQPM